mmetsp:Transcript_13537/g.40819  ORF Transcript_13537/g.40819 Transcript_13537/m.40819 type:complete len:506 (+) Transcript_13537:2491-4008(+)
MIRRRAGQHVEQRLLGGPYQHRSVVHRGEHGASGQRQRGGHRLLALSRLTRCPSGTEWPVFDVDIATTRKKIQRRTRSITSSGSRRVRWEQITGALAAALIAEQIEAVETAPPIRVQQLVSARLAHTAKGVQRGLHLGGDGLEGESGHARFQLSGLLALLIPVLIVVRRAGASVFEACVTVVREGLSEFIARKEENAHLRTGGHHRCHGAHAGEPADLAHGLTGRNHRQQALLLLWLRRRRRQRHHRLTLQQLEESHSVTASVGARTRARISVFTTAAAADQILTLGVDTLLGVGQQLSPAGRFQRKHTATAARSHTVAGQCAGLGSDLIGFAVARKALLGDTRRERVRRRGVGGGERTRRRHLSYLTRVGPAHRTFACTWHRSREGRRSAASIIAALMVSALLGAFAGMRGAADGLERDGTELWTGEGGRDEGAECEPFFAHVQHLDRAQLGATEGRTGERDGLGEQLVGGREQLSNLQAQKAQKAKHQCRMVSLQSRENIRIE